MYFSALYSAPDFPYRFQRIISPIDESCKRFQNYHIVRLVLNNSTVRISCADYKYYALGEPLNNKNVIFIYFVVVIVCGRRVIFMLTENRHDAVDQFDRTFLFLFHLKRMERERERCNIIRINSRLNSHLCWTRTHYSHIILLNVSPSFIYKH